MSTVNINGKTYVGNTIKVLNGVVWIDGKRQDDIQGTDGILKVEILGNLEKLECDGNVVLAGDAGKINAGGSVDCHGNVTGNINAGGSISCGSVGGNCSAGGSIMRGK